MEERDFCEQVEKIKEYVLKIKPILKSIREKERKDLTAEDFVIMAEATHKLWIISEVLKGRTAFLLEESDTEAESSTALTTKEMIDLYGRKIAEARNKLLINKK